MLNREFIADLKQERVRNVMRYVEYTREFPPNCMRIDVTFRYDDGSILKTSWTQQTAKRSLREKVLVFLGLKKPMQVVLSEQEDDSE